MINQLDLRRALIALAGLVIIWPWLIFRVLSLVIGGADQLFSGCWHAMHRWANPDLYGKAPVRCRRLMYSRRTVENLLLQAESLNRQIRRQAYHTASTGQIAIQDEPQDAGTAVKERTATESVPEPQEVRMKDTWTKNGQDS